MDGGIDMMVETRLADVESRLAAVETSVAEQQTEDATDSAIGGDYVKQPFDIADGDEYAPDKHPFDIETDENGVRKIVRCDVFCDGMKYGLYDFEIPDGARTVWLVMEGTFSVTDSDGDRAEYASNDTDNARLRTVPHFFLTADESVANRDRATSDNPSSNNHQFARLYDFDEDGNVAVDYRHVQTSFTHHMGLHPSTLRYTDGEGETKEATILSDRAEIDISEKGLMLEAGDNVEIDERTDEGGAKVYRISAQVPESGSGSGGSGSGGSEGGEEQSVAGVDSVNGATGALEVVGGDRVSVQTVGQTISVDVQPETVVTSLNGATGDVGIYAGTGAVVTTSGKAVTVAFDSSGLQDMVDEAVSNLELPKGADASLDVSATATEGGTEVTLTPYSGGVAGQSATFMVLNGTDGQDGDPGADGLNSLNGEVGDLSLIGGENIEVATLGKTIRISYKEGKGADADPNAAQEKPCHPGDDGEGVSPFDDGHGGGVGGGGGGGGVPGGGDAHGGVPCTDC